MTTLVQTKAGTLSGGAIITLELDVALTSAVTSGSALAIGMQWSTAGSGTPSITDDKGNIYTIDKNINDPFSGDNLVIAHCLNVTNGPQTIKLTAASATSGTIFVDAQVYEVSAGTAAFDTSTSGANPSTVTLNGAITTAAANDFSWAVVAVSSGVTYTQNNGWTQDSTNAGTSDFYFHNILTSSGANSINATASSSIHHAWVMGAISPGSVGPPPVPPQGPMPRQIYVMP